MPVAEQKLRRAVQLSRLSGWSLLIFGVLSFLLSLADPFSSSMVIALVLLTVGVAEIRYGGRLRAGEKGVLEKLAVNQLVLGLSIAAYGGWQWWRVSRTDLEVYFRAPLVQHLAVLLEPEVIGLLEDMAGVLIAALYLGVIAGALLGCGGMAFYYRSRRRWVGDSGERTIGGCGR